MRVCVFGEGHFLEGMFFGGEDEFNLGAARCCLRGGRNIAKHGTGYKYHFFQNSKLLQHGRVAKYHE